MVPEFLTIAEAARLIESASCRRSNWSKAGSSASRGSTAGSTASSGCWRTRPAPEARAAEAEIAAGRYRGPLHGIPIGLKDIYETAGVADHRPFQGHAGPCADGRRVLGQAAARRRRGRRRQAGDA